MTPNVFHVHLRAHNGVTIAPRTEAARLTKQAASRWAPRCQRQTAVSARFRTDGLSGRETTRLLQICQARLPNRAESRHQRWTLHEDSPAPWALNELTAASFHSEYDRHLG